MHACFAPLQVLSCAVPEECPCLQVKLSDIGGTLAGVDKRQKARPLFGLVDGHLCVWSGDIKQTCRHQYNHVARSSTLPLQFFRCISACAHGQLMPVRVLLLPMCFDRALKQQWGAAWPQCACWSKRRLQCRAVCSTLQRTRRGPRRGPTAFCFKTLVNTERRVWRLRTDHALLDMLGAEAQARRAVR
jgi:hypothetical protein